MAQITVKIRTDIGDPGRHPKYGNLEPAQSVTIDEEDFGGGLFERPSPDYLSPLELADKARGEELKQSVGTFEYVEPVRTPTKGRKGASVTPIVEEPISETPVVEEPTVKVPTIEESALSGAEGEVANVA